MTLQATMYGAGSIGGSNQDPATDIAYAIPVTVTADGLAVAIEVGMIGPQFTPAAYLLADNGGVPGQVLAVFAGRKGLPLVPSTTARWLTCPVMHWVAAGNYWIGAASLYSAGAGQIRYTAGSGYTVDGTSSQALHEPGSTGTTSTATARQYSLRLVVLTEAIAPITGVLGAVQAAQTAQLTGTSTDPLPPTPPSSGNRMGGTGAVRKPPR